MAYEYRVRDGVVVRADPENIAGTMQTWVKGAGWRDEDRDIRDWIEGYPLTEAEAHRLMQS